VCLDMPAAQPSTRIADLQGIALRAAAGMSASAASCTRCGESVAVGRRSIRRRPSTASGKKCCAFVPSGPESSAQGLEIRLASQHDRIFKRLRHRREIA